VVTAQGQSITGIESRLGTLVHGLFFGMLRLLGGDTSNQILELLRVRLADVTRGISLPPVLVVLVFGRSTGAILPKAFRFFWGFLLNCEGPLSVCPD